MIRQAAAWCVAVALAMTPVPVARADWKPPTVHAESQVWPEIPGTAPVGNIEVQVVLTALIRTDGSARFTEILHCTLPSVGFEEEAGRAVRQWQFRPAIRDGKPVEVRWTVLVLFLRDESGMPAFWSDTGATWDILLDAADREFGWHHPDMAADLSFRAATAAAEESVPVLDLAPRLDRAALNLLFAGRPERARELLDQALRLLAEDGSEAGPVREAERSIVQHQSRALLEQGLEREARPYLERWVALLAALEDPSADEIAASHLILGSLYLAEGRLDDAAPLLERAREHVRDVPGTFGRGQVLEALIRLRIGQGRIEEAEALVDPYLEETRRYGGEALAESRRAFLAELFEGSGRPEGAGMALRSKLRELEARRGTESPESIPLLILRADVEAEQGEIEKALATLQQALDIAEKKLPPGAPILAEIHYARGVLLALHGDQKAGEQELDQSVRLFDLAGVESSDVLAQALLQLGALRMQRGEMEDASVLLRRALRLSEEAYGDSVVLLNPLLVLAICESIRGRFAEAEPLLRRAWEIADGAGEVPVELRREILMRQSMVLRALGRDEEAATAESRLRALRPGSGGGEE